MCASVVAGVTEAIQVDSGGTDGCALLPSGNAQCWGWNNAGQLGSGTDEEISNTPVEVSGVTNAEALTTGGFFECVLLPTGHVECLGSDQWGQLGNGISQEKGLDTPVEVEGLTEATR